MNDLNDNDFESECEFKLIHMLETIDPMNTIYYHDKILRLYSNSKIQMSVYAIIFILLWPVLLKKINPLYGLIVLFAMIYTLIPSILLANKQILRLLYLRFEYIYLNINVIVFIIFMSMLLDELRYIIVIASGIALLIIINYDTRLLPPLITPKFYKLRPLFGTIMVTSSNVIIIFLIYIDEIQVKIETWRYKNMTMTNHQIMLTSFINLYLFILKNVIKLTKGQLSIIHDSVQILNSSKIRIIIQ